MRRRWSEVGLREERIAESPYQYSRSARAPVAKSIAVSRPEEGGEGCDDEMNGLVEIKRT